MALDQLPYPLAQSPTINYRVVRSAFVYSRSKLVASPTTFFTSFRHFIFRSFSPHDRRLRLAFVTFRFDPFSISSEYRYRLRDETSDFHFRFKLLYQYFSIFVYSDEGNLVRRRYLLRVATKMSKFFPLSEFQSRGSERTRSTPLRNCKIPSYLTRDSCPRV